MEKLRKFSENPIWRLAMDFVQITGVSFLTLVGSINAVKFAGGKWIFLILLTILLVIVSFWIFGRFKELYKGIKYEKVKIESNEIQRKIEEDFPSGIPSNRIMGSWFGAIEEKARNWDPDAKLTSLNLYLNHGYETVYFQPKPNLQAFYWSSTKQLQASFYMPSDAEIGVIEEENYHDKPKKPFFKTYPKWREALKRAYLIVNDTLPAVFQVQVADGDNEITFNFSYKMARVQKKASFLYNGLVLKDPHGKQISIK